MFTDFPDAILFTIGSVWLAYAATFQQRSFTRPQTHNIKATHKDASIIPRVRVKAIERVVNPIPRKISLRNRVYSWTGCDLALIAQDRLIQRNKQWNKEARRKKRNDSAASVMLKNWRATNWKAYITIKIKALTEITRTMEVAVIAEVETASVYDRTTTYQYQHYSLH